MMGLYGLKEATVVSVSTSAENRTNVYLKAQKAAYKAAKAAQQSGANPYLPSLEELVPGANQLARASLGLLSIPMDAIVGTATVGRTPAFACNFMPLLNDGTEFATKWQFLYQSVVDDGLRDPVKVLEYMNKYYAVEGNKRISVMKLLDCPMIEADVTRVIPAKSEDKDVRIYYEYMSFFEDSGIVGLTFSEEGCYAKLCDLIGQKLGEKWNEEDVMNFRAVYTRFCDAYHKVDNKVDNKLHKITAGDAFLLYLQAFGYQDGELTGDRIASNIGRVIGEFRTQAQDAPIALKMSPEGQKPSLIQQIIRPAPSQLKVCFINTRSPEVSGWTYWHELGKNHVDSVLGKKLTTQMISDVSPRDCQGAIEAAVKDGANVVFTTSPLLLDGAMKAAMKLPNAKILNCSLLPVYNSVRSYYLRMYQAKFVLGAIAGAVSDNNRIGYIADYPVYGIPANVNAFALGARLVNPRAQVFLEWSTVQGSNPEAALAEKDVRVICNRDIAAPALESTVFGLYLNEDGKTHNLAMPVWHWGIMYEELLRRIQNGFWDTDMNPKNAQAMNYWWGMEAGAVDVYYSKKLDAGTRRLIEMIRTQIIKGQLHSFAGQIVSQDGTVRCHDDEKLTPAQIIAMDWLCDNVIGTIPDLEDMKPEAVPFVSMQGLKTMRAPDTSEIKWVSTAADGD